MRHPVIDFAAKITKERTLFLYIFRIYQIRLFIQCVYQLEHLLRRVLSVIVKTDDNISRHLSVSGHKRRVLAKVFCEANAVNIRIIPAHFADNSPRIVRRIVIHQDYFILKLTPHKHGIDDISDNVSYSLGTVVAWNDKTDFLHDSILCLAVEVPQCFMNDCFRFLVFNMIIYR